MKYRPECSVEWFNGFAKGSLPDHLGIEILEAEQGRLLARFEVRHALMAPNGFLHAGSLVSLADTAAGYACVAHLPEGASGFTTIELKANFPGTTREGFVECEATAVHLGGSTQLWDATCRRAGETKPIALFRCTQLILRPR
jgi:uncharacterized protein (TIGR00369 family)